jgi:hypothetical protein
MSAAPSIDMLLAQAPRAIRKNFALWKEAVRAVDSAPNGRKHRVARKAARKLGVGVQYVFSRCSEWRKRGDLALIDKRHSGACWQTRHGLPAPAVAHLQALAAEGRLNAQAACRQFIRQLYRWRKGDALAAIPGFASPPVGNPPPGWSFRNLSRLLPRTAKPLGKVRWTTIIMEYYSGKIVVTKTKGDAKP